MSDEQVKTRQKIHRTSFEQRFPQLAHVPFEHSWSCVEGISANSTHFFGKQADNTYLAGGFNGSGVTRGTAFGCALAEFANGHSSNLISDCLANCPCTMAAASPTARHWRIFYSALTLSRCWTRPLNLAQRQFFDTIATIDVVAELSDAALGRPSGDVGEILPERAQIPEPVCCLLNQWYIQSDGVTNRGYLSKSKSPNRAHFEHAHSLMMQIG